MRILIAVTALAACSNSSSGSHTNVDAPGSGSNHLPDAPPSTIDAPPAATTSESVGMACSPGPSGMIDQGTCPSGYMCLNLMGGTHGWCSRTCTPGAMDTCKTGYPGPGLANCYLGVTPAGGGAAITFCGVICEDDTTGPPNQYCPATTCNDTCPSTPTLACTAAIKTMAGTTIAKGCQ